MAVAKRARNDRATIAFISERDGGARLWTIPSAGDAPTRITNVGAFQPSWSPSGEWIAFASQGDIWAVDPGGGDPAPVTSGDALDSHPAWSPDGSRILFTRRIGADSNLWIVEFASTSVEPESWAGIKAHYRASGR